MFEQKYYICFPHINSKFTRTSKNNYDRYYNLMRDTICILNIGHWGQNSHLFNYSDGSYEKTIYTTVGDSLGARGAFLKCPVLKKVTKVYSWDYHAGEINE